MIRRFCILSCFALIALSLTHRTSLAQGSAIRVGPSENIFGFWYVDKALYLSSQSGFYRSTDGTTWTQLQPAGMNGGSLAVLPSGEIFIFGYDSYRLSTDNGSTWSTTTQTGFSTRTAIVDSTGTLYLGENDPIYVSHDKAHTWVKSNPGASPNFFDVSEMVLAPDGSLFAGNQGITGGYVYRTTNHGTSWKSVHAESMSDVSSIEVYPSGSIILTYFNNKTIRSDDGGSTWTTVSTPTTAAYPHASVFVSHDLGYALVPGGRVVRTTDGGVTWDSSATLFDQAGFTTLFVGPRASLYAGSSQGLYKLSATAGVATVSENSVIRTFPNPAHSVVHVSAGDLKSDASIQIYDINGDRVRTTEVAGGLKDCDVFVGDLPSGLYCIVVDDSKTRKTAAVTIQH